MDAALQIEENQLKGCQSVVYFSFDTDKRVVFISARRLMPQLFRADRAVIAGIFCTHAARNLALSPDFLEKIGLDKHLSPTRKNGLASMVEAIRRAADQNLKTE